MQRIRSFIRRRRKTTLTLMVIPDATRSPRTWRLSLLRLDALVGLAATIVGIALATSIWAGNSASTLIHYRQTIESLNEENSQLKMTMSEQEARLYEMAVETANLAERIAELQQVADEIREIVPVAEVVGLEDSGRLSTRLNGSVDTDVSFVAEVKGEGTPGPAVLDGMGGGDWDTRELESWLQGNLDSLGVAVEHHSHLLAQLKISAEEYDHRLRHTPSVWPVTGRVTSEYGMRRHPISGRNQLHAGIDIAVPTGTPVAATAAGKVVHAGPDGGYGITVVIDHGYGIRTLYAHNSRVTVQVGDEVQRGDVIALAGSTGASTGPHVHYEVRLNGRPVDPREYLPR